MRALNRRKVSLSLKIGSLLIFTLIALGLANIYVVARSHRQMMFTEFSSKGYAIALSLANSAMETLLFHDASSVQSFVDNYRGIDGVSYIFLVSGDGEVLAHTFVPAFPPELRSANRVPPGKNSSQATIKLGGRGEVLDVAVPVLYGVIGQVHVGMDLGMVRQAVTRLILSIMWQFGLALVLGVVLVYVALYFMIRPVRDLARVSSALGGGDLRVEVAEGGGDEIGDLSRSFQRMVNSLREVVGGVVQSRAAMSEATGNISVVMEQILDGVQAEQVSVHNTEGRMDEMKGLSEGISASLVGLGGSSSRTSASATEIHRAAAAIVDGTRRLYTTVENTSSTLNELDAAIREVGRNVGSLRDVASANASSAQHIDDSIRTVEAKAAEVARITSDLEHKFATGIEAVNTTIGGMQEIRASSASVTTMIGNLAESMKEIEKVLNLIVDINDQTGLLALNAAIIAAQVGGKGHGFSVVADEMKALSQRTEKSANEIAVMVRTVRKEATAAMQAVRRADGRTEELFSLSRTSGEVLHAIQASVQEVNGRMGEIARVTRDQSELGGAVKKAAHDLSSAVERLAAAGTEQAASSARLLKEAEGLKDVAEMVDRSAGEQARETKDIEVRVQEIHSTIESVRGATEAQMTAVQTALGALIIIAGISDRNNAMVRDLGNVIGGLRVASDSLKNELDKFTM